MKNYVALQVTVHFMDNADVVTFSNGKDNDVKDDVWFED